MTDEKDFVITKDMDEVERRTGYIGIVEVDGEKHAMTRFNRLCRVPESRVDMIEEAVSCVYGDSEEPTVFNGYLVVKEHPRDRSAVNNINAYSDAEVRRKTVIGAVCVAGAITVIAPAAVGITVGAYAVYKFLTW